MPTEMSFIYSYKENSKGPRMVLRNNYSPIRFNTIYFYPLLSEAKESIYSIQYCSTYSMAKQFDFQEFMGRSIEGCFKIQYKSVNLAFFVYKDFCPIIYHRSQLSFTCMPFPKCVLPVRQEFIFIKMDHYI